MNVEFTLNGRKVSAAIEADDSLFTVLRGLGMYSVKCGCETTNCGLCTVHMDGKAVLSCSVPAARCAGHAITTLEGLQEEARRLGECLAGEGAEQCGFCAPGMMMNVFALAKENPRATEAEIDAYLAGNLCRCSGYVSQRRAVKKYLDMVAGEVGA
ncbi:MAG: 2Fe-2S iron-sulfur cluster binding domain-containing protein [Clostridiales bacterium]|nr:2Fe-2S iron-sulfur cluster binding domain-containing protein [Clostridiales bacterium]